jgi:cyclase
LVYVPDDKIVFTGDILFMGSHPIIWAGPIENWIQACDVLLALDVDVVVPGHGPLTDKRGVQTTRDYWTQLQTAVKQGTEQGASAFDIARELVRKHDYNEAERVVVNVDLALRALCQQSAQADPLSILARMANFARASQQA